MIKSLKYIIHHNRELILNTEKICAIWFDSKNSGDALNPILIQHLSGKKPFLLIKYSINLNNNPIYTVIGSILDHPIVTKKILKNTIIWGTGFVFESGRLQGIP
jgi:pyruvyltransferase